MILQYFTDASRRPDSRKKSLKCVLCVTTSQYWISVWAGVYRSCLWPEGGPPAPGPQPLLLCPASVLSVCSTLPLRTVNHTQVGHRLMIPTALKTLVVGFKGAFTRFICVVDCRICVIEAAS